MKAVANVEIPTTNNIKYVYFHSILTLKKEYSLLGMRMTLGSSLWIGHPAQWSQRMNLTCQNEEKWTAGQLESGEDGLGDHHCDDPP